MHSILWWHKQIPTTHCGHVRSRKERLENFREIGNLNMRSLYENQCKTREGMRTNLYLGGHHELGVGHFIRKMREAILRLDADMKGFECGRV